MNGSSPVGPWLRHFSYMLAHQDAHHLWPNLVSQLVLASAATASRPAAGVLLGQARVLAVYLLAVLGGGVAFTLVEVRSSVTKLRLSDTISTLSGYPHPSCHILT